MSKEIIIKTKRTTNYAYLNSKRDATPALLLHGFTGSHSSWEEVIGRIEVAAIALDIPGHGKSTFNNLDVDYSIDCWCEDLNEILDSLKVNKVNLCGYSMGGRLATAFAAKYPKRINKLILESASYGIEDLEDRKERFEEDLKLCNLIEEDFLKFVKKWEDSALFVKQRRRNLESFLNQKKKRLSHNPIHLSKALRSFSQGKMDFYLHNISKFEFPIVIINGAEDKKYVQIGGQISALANRGKHHIIPNSGHNVHLENLDLFIDCLNL